MQKYNDTQYLSIDSFQKDIDLYIDKLKNKELKKIIIKNPPKQDVVVLSIDDYERLKDLDEKLKDLYEKVKSCQMN
jgi:PHD/YefM family antitoxin component YafN of YafNO toxin-antitoxin module